MKFKTQTELFTHYKKRFSYFEEYELIEPFKDNCQFSIVIPCFNEPNLLGTLNSLVSANSPTTPFHVLVVLNASTEVSEEEKAQNNRTKQDFYNWLEKTDCAFLDFTLLEATNFPHKKAGVGLARKIGMDQAFKQFATQEKKGFIINLDADCTISADYLTASEKQLTQDARGGHFQFEHIIDEVTDPDLKEGIIQYELHLRYHNQGLIYTGFPHAEHTVGSCMIVRSDVYGLLGGMNQRKAGEDFYFMNKVYQGGNCLTISNAKVFPSARVSDRVPFGTGRAQGNWKSNSSLELETYNPKIYYVIKGFIEVLFQNNASGLASFPEEIRPFLEDTSFIEQWEKVKERSTNEDIYKKNVFQLCDAFMLLKMVHYLRDHGFNNMPVYKASDLFFKQLKPNDTQKEYNTLLEKYRELEMV